MKYVGVDLHKKVIKVCVVRVVRRKRKVVIRKRFECCQTAAIREFFKDLGKFQAVVEATASYKWFFLLVADLADRMVLAHYNADIAELFTKKRHQGENSANAQGVLQLSATPTSSRWAARFGRPALG